MSVGAGLAEQLLTGSGSEWANILPAFLHVWLHNCCCCPILCSLHTFRFCTFVYGCSKCVCSSCNIEKHKVKAEAFFLCLCLDCQNGFNPYISLIYTEFFCTCTLFWPSQNWLLNLTHQTTQEQTPSSSTSHKQTVSHRLIWDDQGILHVFVSLNVSFFNFTVRDKRKSNHTNHVSDMRVPLQTYFLY